MQSHVAPVTDIKASSSGSVSQGTWKIALFVACVALLLNLIVLFWGLNRGLDVDVESFYLVQYQHPYDYPAFSSFHLLLSKLPKLAANEILHYRLLEVIFRIVPAAMLGYGVAVWASQWVNLSSMKISLLAVIAMIGGTMSLCCFPRTISYNGLSSGLLVFSVAFAFLAMSRSFRAVDNSLEVLKNRTLQTLTFPNRTSTNQPIRIRTFLFLFASGFSVALSLFVKITSALVLVPVVFLFVLSQKGGVRACLAFSGGICAGGIFFFSGVQNYAEWRTIFGEAFNFELNTDHSPSGMLDSILFFWQKHWWQAFVGFGLSAATHIFLARLEKIKQDQFAAKLAVCFSGLIGLAMVILSMRLNLLQARESVLVICTLGFMVTLLSVRSGFSRPFLVGNVVLLLLPLIAAVGTNCSILPHLMSNSASWFLFIGLAAVVLGENFNASFAMATVPIALVCFSALQFFGQYVFFRDDSLKLLRETATTTKIPLLDGMSLNKEDIEFYEGAQQILTANGFKTGDYILSLYDFPAIVYAVNAKSPGQSWYISWPERDELNAVYFKKAHLNSRDRLFVVLSGRDQNQIVEPHMQTALRDIRSRRKFVRIGTLPHPRRPDFKVYIYANQLNL